MRSATPLRLRALVAATAVAALIGCSSDDDAGSPGAIDAGATTTTTDDGGTEATEGTSDTGTQGAEVDPTSVLAPRDGTWVVGDAGEVDVTVADGALVLDDVRADDGWEVSVEVEAPDEIEVDFRQGAVEWQIEIEYEGGILEIEIDQDIDPAEPGVIPVGEAGTVEFALDGGALALVGTTTEEGWEVAVTEETAEDIELSFRQGLAVYDVDIDLDDGRVEVEVDFEVEGRFPA